MEQRHWYPNLWHAFSVLWLGILIGFAPMVAAFDWNSSQLWPMLIESPKRRGGARRPEIPLDRIFFINLDRRPERREHFQQQVLTLGLDNITLRVSAVDGAKLDLDEYPRTVATEEAVQTAGNPPDHALGMIPTRGALGMALTYHSLLQQIAEDPVDEHTYMICEDDVWFSEEFVSELRDTLNALDDYDPRWHFLHAGYFQDKSSMEPLPGRMGEYLNWPRNPTYGLFASIMHPAGARRLLEVLFPISIQLDCAISQSFGKFRAYATNPSLVTAPHSQDSTSDIQLL